MIPVWSSEGLWLYGANLDHEAVGFVSSSEWVRAQGIGNELVRQRSLARRSLLRRLLAQRVGMPTESLTILTKPRGKPYLPGMGLEFSISSSDEQVVVLISEVGPVGTDIERIDPNFDFEGVLREHFTPTEIRRLGEDRARSFYRGWVLKEACAKVEGNGIGDSLRRYEVDPDMVGWQNVAQRLRAQIVPCEGGYAVAIAGLPPHEATS